MKKIIAFLFSILCLFSFVGCKNDTAEQRDWRKDFQVSCTHIDESKFDNPADKACALIDGTFVFEHDEYEITNKTNYVAEQVYLVFYVDSVGVEPFNFKQYVGTIKQGETKTEEITEAIVEMNQTFPDGVIFDFNDCILIEIEYKLK